MHDSFTEAVASFLYDREPGDTFAAIIETRGSTLGPRTEYVRVESVYDGISRDRVMKINHRRTPDEDYWIPNSIYHCETGDGVEIRHLGPPNEDIHAVSDDTLKLDYSSNHHLVATCEECQNSGRLPVSSHEMPLVDPLLVEERGKTITACCRSADYTVSLASDTV